MTSGKKISKLAQLAAMEGYDTIEAMLEDQSTDSIASCICVNYGCDYSEQLEPDCENGYCPECQETSMKSCFVLAGII